MTRRDLIAVPVRWLLWVLPVAVPFTIGLGAGIAVDRQVSASAFFPALVWSEGTATPSFVVAFFAVRRATWFLKAVAGGMDAVASWARWESADSEVADDHDRGES